ncbi:hypothetical protein CHX26_00670 [Porphyrobacter sp. HT-58-2]|nr:hypothetical protein CHX26_00670 [Porphyrobacter sp. HT-58-2]
MRLSRLVVLKSGLRAYDEEFHAGVNIIRGVPGRGNSVGKSTIADMIFFALGGDLTRWKPEAASCDQVLAEVVVNGSVVTLRREIAEAPQQPMWIYFGDFDTASGAGTDGWQRYSYRRMSDRESFTQVLFRLMDMPEVPAEAEGNITMHQLLRLMYVDQMTPVDRIFRAERNDSALRRQAVGDLLCGVFDARLYPAQLELREKEKAYEAAAQQYGALSRVLAAAGEAFNLDFVEARRRSLEADIATIQTEIQALKSHRFDERQLAPGQSSIVATIKTDLDRVNGDIAELQVLVGQLTYNIADADMLIDEIQRTLARLREGEVASSALGPLNFLFCPSCFSPLKDTDHEHQCKLCRSDVEPDGDRSRFARMRNELEIQLKESNHLQAKRREDLTAATLRAAKLTGIRDTLATEYLNLTRNYLTETDAQIDRLNSRLGYSERELIELQRERQLAEQLAELSRMKAELNEDITRLKEDIVLWRGQRDRQQENVYRMIQERTAMILAKDVHTEAEFTEESDVYFDFSEDRVTVNGKSGFSASSLTVIRNAFHLALHWVSCTSPILRYPRFLLLDNIEDKGMTEQRSQNFQRMIAAISEKLEAEHQIIYTTSMVDPDLDESDMTVGERYDFSNKALKIGLGPS